MYLSGRKTAPVHGQCKHRVGQKRTASNREPDVNLVSTAPEEEESSNNDEHMIFTCGQEPAKMRVPEINVEINEVVMVQPQTYWMKQHF